MNKIELLAPSGNIESFMTAVSSGADAVYSLGSEVEILSPLHLRKRMARELQEAADKYK